MTTYDDWADDYDPARAGPCIRRPTMDDIPYTLPEDLYEERSYSPCSTCDDTGRVSEICPGRNGLGCHTCRGTGELIVPCPECGEEESC